MYVDYDFIQRFSLGLLCLIRFRTGCFNCSTVKTACRDRSAEQPLEESDEVTAAKTQALLGNPLQAQSTKYDVHMISILGFVTVILRIYSGPLGLIWTKTS